jgi:hypothetical protein
MRPASCPALRQEREARGDRLPVGTTPRRNAGGRDPRPRPHQACGYQLALITRDLEASAGKIVERSANRRPTEVAFQDGKQLSGVGHARDRTENDVVAEHRQRAAWYLTKTALHSPTCSPSSAASSSPPNFTPDKGQTPYTTRNHTSPPGMGCRRPLNCESRVELQLEG